jgi:Sporulation and spore germination
MIPRYQRILYWIFVGGILLLTLILIRGCERKHERILAMRDQSPIAAPTDIPNEQATIARANDADASISLDQVSLALPAEPALRARVLVDRCLTDLSLPDSTHPVPPGPGVTEVFLLPLPVTNPATPASEPNSDTPLPTSPYGLYHANGTMLAVVNLTKAWADAHPSGIESEDLTLRVIIATLQANNSDIEEVRFLVDGQPRDTLNGHADLTRPYNVSEPAKSIHVLSPDGNPL